jgi:uncharacterized membrane protein
MRLIRVARALLPAILWLMPHPAHAAMIFCNRTQQPVEAAFGYRENSEWVSEGWWRIEAHQCARVFAGPLTQRFYFYFARTLAQNDHSPPTWTGKYELCVDAKAFRIEGDEDCKARKYRSQGFHKVDIGSNARDYTLDFKNDSDSH